MDQPGLHSLDELASQKEKEWKNITSLQISSLREALSKKEQEHKDLSTMFAKLKDDFKYNLKLLQERDRELKHYDNSFTKVKAMESTHVAEISDLKIRLAKAQTSLESSKQATNELQRHYRQRLIDQQAEFEAFKTAKDAEIDETLSQLSRVKSYHERQEAKLQAEIEAQRYDITAEIDKVLRVKEREFKEKEENLSSEAVSEQLRSKLLSKEIEIMKSAHETQVETLQKVEDTNTTLRKRVQEAEFNLKDMSAMKNARILELEEKNKQLEAKQASLHDEYDKRHKELDTDVRIRQANVDACRRNFLEKEKTLELKFREFRIRAETAENETRRTLTDRTELVKNHKKMASNYESEMQDLRAKHETEMKRKTELITSKDVHIQNLQMKVDLLEKEIEQLNQITGDYKRKIASSAQKENLLLKSKVEMKFDWQKRYEESEAIIENLSKSRDAAVRELRMLQQQRGMPIQDHAGADRDDFDLKRLKDLEEQNAQLRSVVQQMTSDMQQLAGGDNISVQNAQNTDSDKVFLEKETQTNEYFAVTEVVAPKPHSPVISASFAHPDVKAHIASLNITIGNLRAEKVDMGTQLQKIQVRLRHQESLLHTRENDAKKHLAHMRELEYKLSSTTRRAEQEAESLKRQISDLELQLAETRTEADEYYRRGIQNNLIATELGSELSKMKVDTAAKTPWMAGVAQAGIVQQLQSEVTTLRKQLVEAKQALILGGEKPTKATALNKRLHDKLRLAASQIASLLAEKSKLLESGNSLRAELGLYKKRHPEYGATDPEKDHDIQKDEEVANKLNKMEELQYQLTKQELQYAQKVQPPLPLVEPPTPPTTSTPTSTNQVANPYGQHPLQYSLSSVGDGSLKNIWNMLDQEPSSPSVPGSITGSISVMRATKRGNASGGKGVNKHGRDTQTRPETRRPIKTKTKTPKIRNYNIKDDDKARTQPRR